MAIHLSQAPPPFADPAGGRPKAGGFPDFRRRGPAYGRLDPTKGGAMRTTWMRLIGPSVIAGVVLLATASPALAAPPANDTEDGAIVVGAPPFVHSMDSSGASGDGPRFCANDGSVFYRYTPSADVRIQVDTIGSTFDTVLAIYTRDADGTAHEVGCDWGRFGGASGLRVRMRAGSTYFIMVGRCCGNGRDGGGPLTLSVEAVDDTVLVATSELALPVTVDLETGMATVSGVVTCNERSYVYPQGVLRQLRDGMWVARAWYWAAVPCLPGESVSWSREIDTDGVIAFGPGPAKLWTWDYASDGFADDVSFDGTSQRVQLVSG
jgi:hypothetical protein